MNTVLMTKNGKEKIRTYAVAKGCTIKKEGGLCWETPAFGMDNDSKYNPTRKIEYVGVYGDKVAVRDSKEGIVCL